MDSHLTSVTVSMAAVIIGYLVRLSFNFLLLNSASLGNTWLSAGMSNTSSKLQTFFQNLCPTRHWSLLFLSFWADSFVLDLHTILWKFVNYIYSRKHKKSILVTYGRDSFYWFIFYLLFKNNLVPLPLTSDGLPCNFTRSFTTFLKVILYTSPISQSKFSIRRSRIGPSSF